MRELINLLPTGLTSLLIGFVMGTITAFVFEPIKQERAKKKKAMKVRSEIYRELSHFYFPLVHMDVDNLPYRQDIRQQHIRSLKLDAYGYYYNQQRETFYDIPDWMGIKNMAERLDEIRSEMVNDNQDGETATQNVMIAFIKSFDSGELDDSEFVKYFDISAIRREEDLFLRKVNLEEYLLKRILTR